MLQTDLLPVRFRTKLEVVVDSGCWLWRAARDQKGYGFYWIGRRDSGRMYRAHRVAYEILVGPIADGLVLDHLCRVPSCVNPEHLEAVEPGENTRRGEAPTIILSRGGTCRRGHLLDRVNRASGSRYCRTCQAAANRRYRARVKASTSERAS